MHAAIFRIQLCGNRVHPASPTLQRECMCVCVRSMGMIALALTVRFALGWGPIFMFERHQSVAAWKSWLSRTSASTTVLMNFLTEWNTELWCWWWRLEACGKQKGRKIWYGNFLNAISDIEENNLDERRFRFGNNELHFTARLTRGLAIFDEVNCI